MAKADLRKLIAKRQRHLQKLQEQAAHFGAHTPAHILTEIEDTEVELGELRQRLEGAVLPEMPLDRVPEPAPLPPGSRMPLSMNPLFTGREKDLLELARLLLGDGTAAIGPVPGGIAAATGMGGIGKTQLASAFVHRYGQFFEGGVFWLSFAAPAGVPAEVANCGGPAGMGLYTESSGLKLAEQVALVQTGWREPTPRLLVFDNCEDEALLAQWRPTTGGSRVLVTSRRGRWSKSSGVAVLPLDILSRVESIALLRKFRPDLAKDDPDLNGIAEEVGDLPLALHLAGSYLETFQDDPLFGRPADFLAELRDKRLLQHPALQGEEVAPSPTNHILHVGRTFALSLNRLAPDDAIDIVALELLSRAACFAPGEPIPRALLLATLRLDEADREAARRASRGLNRLVELGLLGQEDEGALVLHRLVARFVVSVAVDSKAARTAVEERLLAEADRLNEAGYPAPLMAWQVHLRAVTDIALQRGDEQGAKLSNELGSHLQMIGHLEAARPYFERALDIREQVLGPEHPDTAQSLNNLALLLKDQGEYAAARPYLERARQICEQALGQNHSHTANALNNLAGLLQDQGDYEAAQPLYEQALQIFEETLGPDHPDTARTLNNLALVLKDQGDYGTARPLYERALQIREETLGPEHPATATSLNNLAALFQAEGNYEAARPLFERVLQIVEQTLGPDHPHTANSLNNLAGLLYYQGEYQAARPYFERALQIRERTLGPDHPDTATSLNNLANLLQALKEYGTARSLYDRAWQIRKQTFGLEHPATAASLNNLAGLLRDQGDYEAARPLYIQALAILEQTLGPDHPHTQHVRANLARLDEQGSKGDGPEG